MKSHLGRAHKLEKFLTDGQKKQIASLKSLNNKVKITKKERDEMHESAINAVVNDSCTFNIFQKHGMRAIIQVLKPGYQPPNRKTIANLLKKKYLLEYIYLHSAKNLNFQGTKITWLG